MTVLDTINEEVSKSMVSSCSDEDVEYVKNCASEPPINMNVYATGDRSESVEDATAEPNCERNENQVE